MNESIPGQLQRLKAISKPRLYGALAVGLTIVVATLWLVRRAPADTSRDSAPPALPLVSVAKVGREDLYKEMLIPAEFRPYLDVELHAKVSGFVDKMNVDFGDKVQKDQVLATLVAPDLVAQLHNATATERKAEAAYTNANWIYTRLLGVNKANPNLVAQQDLDTAEANDRTTFAAIAAARADREKYETLVEYLKITAPFDGVITWRYADPGALIQAGTASDTQAMPLVRLSDNYLLRLDFYVSVDYVKDVHLHDPVEVRVESLGGKTFTGTITRFTDMVDKDTRMMETEVEVPNPKLELVPGMYARVVLKVEPRPHTLAIPIEAVSSEKRPTVYLVDRNHQIQEQPVTLGIETPTKYEVLAGLKEGDLVMIGSRSVVRPGQKVEPKLIGSLAEDAAAPGKTTNATQ